MKTWFIFKTDLPQTSPKKLTYKENVFIAMIIYQ